MASAIGRRCQNARSGGRGGSSKTAQDPSPSCRGIDAHEELQFFLLPEWRAPSLEEAVEQSAASDPAANSFEAAVAAAQAPSPSWEWTGTESMHPYWAMRRVPPSKADGTHRLELKQVTLTNVGVGIIAGESVSVTTEVTVPYLTNPEQMLKHGEIVVYIDQPAPTSQKSKGWKQYVGVEEKPIRQNSKTSSKDKDMQSLVIEV